MKDGIDEKRKEIAQELLEKVHASGVFDDLKFTRMSHVEYMGTMDFVVALMVSWMVTFNRVNISPDKLSVVVNDIIGAANDSLLKVTTERN